jgi:rhamnogalacturonyl hydrolase YesR
MPYHLEMSDSVFMGCPILVAAGKLTGEAKYYDMALRHMRFMLKLNLRTDGLHRHSPLNETAWGRGNGFPALGLALCLTDLPKDHPGRKEMLTAFRNHMSAMAKHQDYTGAWHQVVDRPESYRELTVTCMTTFAMIRGIRHGWLDEKTYGPIVKRAWTAIKTRVAPDATLVDVCTGTGKQRSLRDYYDRPAILGYDARGGAMALLVATEMAAWEKERGRK